MMTRLWRVLSDIRGPKDLLIYSEDEVSRWSDPAKIKIPPTLRIRGRDWKNPECQAWRLAARGQ